ncbi:unnamed protein product [Prorocentrum cordatum]|uniref:Uncharacterized protein n=1 Tax=Prorocentrum cordatum TaxID=2364126 RepID=A0ABN9PBM6_9DINO|nr:unnamed protein product [Polarella glacialis]
MLRSKDAAEEGKTLQDKLKDQIPLSICPLLCIVSFSFPFLVSGASMRENLVFKLGTLAIIGCFAAAYVFGYWLIAPRNDDGVEVSLGGWRPGIGDHDGSHLYYCGRAFNLPGSDGFCGIHNGPQCPSCERYSASPRHDRVKFYVREMKPKLRITRWLSPMICLAFCFVLWGAPEKDLACSSECWGPMIPSLAAYYLPPRNTSASESLESDLMYVSVFLPVLKPIQILPQIGQPIDDRLSRTMYFGVEMGGILVVTAMILEIARFLCKGRRRFDGNSNNLNAPLVSNARLSQRQSPHRALWWYKVTFVMYYIAYQVSLWVLMDYGVANGFMNLTTGIDWELWVPFVAAVAMVALVTGISWYLKKAGDDFENPAPKLAMVMTPWLGNEPHIMKDHIAQALCFAAAHCQDDDALRTVGLVLGYMSIAATFFPLLFYFTDPTVFDSLRASHWPIPESPAPGPGLQGHGQRERIQYNCNGVAIMAVMPDKYLRALMGEAPHTLLHIVFAYFFGGGAFIVAAIFFSVSKIIMIPLGRSILKSRIPAHGCTEINLEMFLRSCRDNLNWDSSDDAIQRARKYKWVNVIACLEEVIPDLDFHSDRVLLNALGKAASVDDGTQIDPAAGRYISVLRILRHNLGVRDEKWAAITVDWVKDGILSHGHLSLLEEIDKMIGQKASAKYINEVLDMDARGSLPGETVRALENASRKLGLGTGNQREDNPDTGEIFAAIALHASRVQIVVWLWCFALPVFAFGCGCHFA